MQIKYTTLAVMLLATALSGCGGGGGGEGGGGEQGGSSVPPQIQRIATLAQNMTNVYTWNSNRPRITPHRV